MQFHPTNLRKTILEMAYHGQSVHIGCAFSLVEICSVLYRSVMNLGDKTPKAKERDYLVMSKGHGVMAQYACMRELGWITDHDIQNYFGEGTELKGLSEFNVPGCEVSSGSLGHGLSVGVGMALGSLRKNEKNRVFCIVGDGEMNEGAIWEGLLFASHFKLHNFFLIVDENSFQAMGTTKEVMNLGDIRQKLEAFGFNALDADGHNEEDLLKKMNQLLAIKNDRPKAIVAKTVKGHGVSFMAANNIWHYTRLSSETYQAALKELGGN
jgi:transketolase